MPCRADCDLRQLLLAKEDKISKLQQTKRWVDDLGRQEPHRREEIRGKQEVVTNKLVQALAEAGFLVNQLASGCAICNAQ